MKTATRSNSSEWNTLANRITITRIALIPVFVVVFMAPWPDWFFGAGTSTSNFVQSAILPWVAAAVYGALAGTDGIDGHIARSRNEVTVLGKFLDPLADKILVAAALIALSEMGDLPAWVVLIIISREFIVSGLRMMAATRGVVIAAKMSGKIKTALTLIAIIMFILKRSSVFIYLPKIVYVIFFWLSWAMMAAALIMTIVSMVIYFKQSLYLFTGYREAAEIIFDEAYEIVEKASEKGIKIASAESLTGGMIGSMLTAVPGSSNVFEGGITSYSLDVKQSALGVSADSLREYTAVSEAVALEMVTGVEEKLLSAFDADKRIAISVTGVAGPGADSDGNPAGLVWIGISGCGETVAKQFNFEGEREDVRKSTVLEAYSMILERLD